MTNLLLRLYADDDGDDLLEYALLCGFIALASVLGFQFMSSEMNTAYQSWDAAQQDRWDLNADIADPNSGS